MDLQTGVGKLKRVGPKTAELLYGKGLYTAGDLVSYYPYRYEKYVSLCAVSQAEEGKECAVLLTVIGRGSIIHDWVPHDEVERRFERARHISIWTKLGWLLGGYAWW